MILKHIQQKIKELFDFNNITYTDTDTINGYCAFLDNQEHLIEFNIDYNIDDIDNLPEDIYPNGKIVITISNHNNGIQIFEEKVNYTSIKKVIPESFAKEVKQKLNI